MEQRRRFNCWLWPDGNIGKRLSGQLREEHNALVDSHADLLAALEQCITNDNAVGMRDAGPCAAKRIGYINHVARAAIAKAGGAA